MNTLTEIVVAIFVFFGLWWLYFVGYPKLVLDNTRQRLFRIRDGLFEHAEAGEIRFDSDAYRMLRTTLNGMIQYAHALGPWKFWLSQVGKKLYGRATGGDEFAQEFDKAVAKLRKTEKKIIMRTVHSMHITIVKHMMYRSVALMILFVSLRAIMRSRRTLEGLDRNSPTGRLPRGSVPAATGRPSRRGRRSRGGGRGSEQRPLERWVRRRERDHTLYELDFRASSLASRNPEGWGAYSH